MDYGSARWHNFEQRKANGEVSQRHRRPSTGSGLCTTRIGKASGSCRGRSPANWPFTWNDADRYGGTVRRRPF
jgi:hypothetical protein